MREFPSTMLTRDPATLKDAARKRPVAITEHKRPRFVLMSYEEYERLTQKPKDPRRGVRTNETPDDLRALMLEALDQPYEP